MERAIRVISDTLRAYANWRKDDWDSHLQLAGFAINKTASMLGDDLTSSFIDRGTHLRLPVSPPCHDLAAGESPAHYAQRMLAMEATCGSCSRQRRQTGRQISMRGRRPRAVADQGAARRRRHW